MQTETRSAAKSVRLQHGKRREQQIIKALKQQHDLPLRNATHQEDCELKIDAWLDTKSVQVKYREVGSDILFEVYDLWNGWDRDNKPGRDLISKAQMYAVLSNDKRTVHLVNTSFIKQLVRELLQLVQAYGWSKNGKIKVFKYVRPEGTIELKVQFDPRTGDQKIVAFIPPACIPVDQRQEYKVNLPNLWK